ncbi:MAG: C4-dicarboxylate ABC transporter permease [Paracoccaceae bacterium]|nr:C4-dicarboxylate ABC transporter permease [Paracoccaceae bacterium]
MTAISWILEHIWSALTGLFYIVLNPLTVFDLSNGEAVMRFVYYGASAELFFVFSILSTGFFIAGTLNREFLWRVVGVLEGFSNGVGRLAAWAGLLMVLQQIMVIFLQAIFRVSDIGLGPAGLGFERPLGWWGDGLKFYNAVVVCLCCAYTFVQGGHVRVDLFYAGVRYRTKRAIDMFGALFFMIPALLIMWHYSWFFMWRHLVNPKVNAGDSLEIMIRKGSRFRWQPETIGFSPNGFDAYFLFKVLIVLFCFMMLVQAVTFFYRSWLEFAGGEEEEGRGLDVDRLEASPAAEGAR